MAKKLSKWTRVAAEGETVDGRKIKREWLAQSAKNYDTNTYGARVWIEHLRSYEVDGKFSAQGDVVGLKTQEEIINGEERLTLYAQVSANDSFIEANQKGQKVFSSIEIDEDFAGTGEAYLTGLAMTDSPASLGTQPWAFSTGQKSKQFMSNCDGYLTFDADKKEDAAPFAEKAAAEPSKFAEILDSLRAKILPFKKQSKENSDQVQALAVLMDDVADTFGQTLNTLNEANKGLSEQLAAQTKRLDELEGKYKVLDTTPADANDRPVATGGDGFMSATC